MRRTSIFFASIFAMACDGNSVEPDAGPQVLGCDLPELMPVSASTENPDSETFEPATLDYACLGERTRPEGGAALDATFHLIDFQDDFDVPNATVWLFTDNVIADNCAGPSCQILTTDGMGRATAQLPTGGWYAYRVLPYDDPFSRMSDIFGVFQYNEPAPDASGGTVTGNSVNGVTIDLIPSLLGITRAPGLALIAGRIEDCSGQFVENAVVRIYDPDGNCIEDGPQNDDPHIHYFNGDASNNLPALEVTQSNTDGLYLIVHIPPDPENRPFRVEAWGDVDGEPTLIGCETARIFPDAVTILNMIPLRGDAAAECPSSAP
jgi:hypothetical protein